MILPNLFRLNLDYNMKFIVLLIGKQIYILICLLIDIFDSSYVNIIIKFLILIFPSNSGAKLKPSKIMIYNDDKKYFYPKSNC